MTTEHVDLFTPSGPRPIPGGPLAVATTSPRMPGKQEGCAVAGLHPTSDEASRTAESLPSGCGARGHRSGGDEQPDLIHHIAREVGTHGS